MGSSEIKKQNIASIPKIFLWFHQRSESKISQEFPRSLSGVIRGQKAKFPKNSQDSHQGSPEDKKQNFPRIFKIQDPLELNSFQDTFVFLFCYIWWGSKFM
ncbi:hypothetical protein HOLleu_17224 [Holothuria leucospilota]|uniref:Uncharacterized protein n=1 Tax=Holothuria leucospilota TaxID=206669 RepID=A0A9Q1C7A7_HOLLE|nr:hypothetical protein HOLleu_17224 [Holothuria leucospilota]